MSFYRFIASENARKHDSQQIATVPLPVANLQCETTAGIRAPIPLVGSGGPGGEARPEWSTLMLRGSLYHPSALAIVSRAKVRLFYVKYNITPII